MTASVLVCGAGSAGRRHISNLKALGATVSVWRERSHLASAAAEEFGIDAVVDLDAGLAAADAVVIATATNRHMPIALHAASAGKHLFIEKPLAASRDGVDELAAILQQTGKQCEIGCQLRAHVSLRRLKVHLDGGGDGKVLTFSGHVGQRLDQWRPGTNYRQSYSASATRGGGALMDLIHEIDLVLWLIGSVSDVVCDLRQVSDQDMDADDLANLLLVLQDGAAGQLQLDMISPTYRRGMDIVTERALIRWDYLLGSVVRIDDTGTQTIAAAPENYSRNEMFVAQMRHFLTAIDSPGMAPICGFSDGVRALDVALAAHNSAAAGQWCKVGEGRLQ